MKKVKCINIKPLPGNDVAPPLEIGKEYEVVKIHTETKVTKNLKTSIADVETFDHYDVGLTSNYNYISSKETGKTLPNSGNGGVHWCHPSRFEEVV